VRRLDVQGVQWIGLAIGLAGFALLAWDDLVHGPLFHADVFVNDWVSAHQAAWHLHDVGHWGSYPGDLVVASCAVAVCAVVWFLWGERMVALWAIGGSAASGLFVAGLKTLFARTRPPFEGVPLSNSFPSGHTMGATATLGILLLMGTQVHVDRYRVVGPRAQHIWRGTIITWGVLSLGVGAARVLAQAHWMTDVLASWFLGLAIVSIILRAARIPRRAKAPAPAEVIVGPEKPQVVAAEKAQVKDEKAQVKADEKAVAKEEKAVAKAEGQGAGTPVEPVRPGR
jgi:undecaprenyl-diphosphatase